MLRGLQSVKSKLGLAFGLVFVLICVLGTTAVLALNQADESKEDIYNKNMRGLRHLSQVNITLGRGYARLLQIHAQRSPTAVEEFASFFARAKPEVDDRLARYYPGKVTDAAEKTAAQAMLSNYELISTKLANYLQLAQAGDIAAAERLYETEISAPFEALRSQLRDLVDLQMAQGRTAFEASQAANLQAKVGIFALIAIALALVCAITYWLVRMITRPLSQAGSLVEAIGQGRLDNRIDNPYRDEFGTMLGGLEKMQARLAELVVSVRSSSEAVSVGAREIASGNQELSGRTEQQASSLEETAASMEEMTSTVRQNADNAAQADQLVHQVRNRADEGGQVVDRATAAMGEITAASDKISNIIGMIDEIAFQTNLLALNASVEAARAGEQGRGFAVVATEVRNLASRSAAAAKDIKELVEDSEKKVAYGSSEVTAAGEVLKEIVNSVTKVSDLVSEVASASKEQATGIDQVNTAINEIDSVTQQNAALVEQSSAASMSLEEQASQLRQQMAYFKVAGLSAHDTTEAAAPARPVARAEPESARKTAPAKPQPSAPKADKRPTAAPVIAEEDDGDWATF
ncbi:methyl-accepting chemotaxis protein [Salinisphaera sp.]|uniref:methyl-accepting chemotaxis protein n=1 Tax=Salinisphaera sp. TaxID=1914330 RepID=UPI000C430EFB|nr:methyl-accepting chemotaxis protein [Salinisphaera sp.]MBS64315.1 methyl-accepting chemotaxis protein [Salinisphaera sp.]